MVERRTMKISLKPVGSIEGYVIEELKEKLKQVFGCPAEVAPGITDLDQTYDPERKQYLSSALLASLSILGAERGDKIMGIADIDLYAPGLSFVFGEADTTSDTAIISLYRLRQEYYGLPPDKTLLMERALKETVHELGHVFGLIHCDNSQCVMHFSNSLADTDWKQAKFCSQCRPKLIREGGAN